MNTVKRVIWRLVASIGVLWGVATLTFVTMNITGGDTALAILGGPDALPTQEVLTRVRMEYGLDQPLYAQYAKYLGQLVCGDLGESYRLRIPVSRAISQQIMSTVQLAAWAGMLAVSLSIIVAIATAKRSRWVSSVSSGSELILLSMPTFVLGILLLLAFSFHFQLFPPAGTQGWKSMVLPTFTLALPIAASLTQVLRQELEDILEYPFIAMARARGMSDTGVRIGHALRHALIPLVTLSGFIFAHLLGGAVITETLFARQGVGRLMIDATTNKDIPLVLGITLLAALTYVLVNLIVDLLNTLINPRTAEI